MRPFYAAGPFAGLLVTRPNGEEVSTGHPSCCYINHVFLRANLGEIKRDKGQAELCLDMP